MGTTLIAAVTAMVVLSAGLFVALERPEWVPGMNSLTEEPVLVFLVGSRHGVDMMKKAVDPKRIVAESPDALALVEGRMIVTNAAAVSAPLMAAGWGDRQIELIKVPKSDGLNRGGKQSGGAKGDDPRMDRLVELMSQPELSYGEALFVMSAMNDGLI